MSIIPGKMEEGGGIKIAFVVQWRVGPIPIAEIGASLDFVPLDMEGLVGMKIGAVFKGVTLAVGMYVEVRVGGPSCDVGMTLGLRKRLVSNKPF